MLLRSNYGLMTSIEDDRRRAEDLAIFKRMYRPAVGSGLVMDYFSDTGQSVLSGADMIKVAPQKYTSTVEYANNPIAKSLRDVARVHTADLGTRLFSTQHCGYDHHPQQVPTHAKFLAALTDAIRHLPHDLRPLFQGHGARNSQPLIHKIKNIPGEGGYHRR